MAAAEYFGKANEAFVSEDYEESIKLYTQAIEADSSKDEYYSNRAHAHIKVDNFTDAVNDANKAIDINCKNVKAYLRKGLACFNSEEFETAKEAFTEGQKLDGNDKSFATWIRKCEAELDLIKQTSEGNTEATVGVSNMANGSPAVPPASTTTTPAPPLSMPAGANVRYDWYQTEVFVIVTIMLKNVKKEDCKVDIQETTLSVTVALPSGSDYSLELDLAHAVIPDKSTIKLLSSKIEIKLKKVDGIRWAKLEGDGSAPAVKHFNPDAANPASAHPPKYPSSSTHQRDWDKLVSDITKEEKEEKPEGDAALNSLFQQIYADGTDEVKKAMQKSFVESGGTVLSTNWNEIEKEKTEIKPPDGMEYKKW